MPFGGSLAYHQESGNLPARLALSDEYGHFTFTGRQTAKRLLGR